MRGKIETVSRVNNGHQPSEMTLVLLNNILSLPFLLLLMCWREEHKQFSAYASLDRNFFYAVNVACVVSFGLSACSIWFLSRTTATMYSLVGAINKLPVAMFGLFFFNEIGSAANTASIFLTLLAGLLLVWAKEL